MVCIVDNTNDVFKDIIRLAQKKFEKWRNISDNEFIDILEQDYACGGLDWLYGKNGLIAFVRYEVINEGSLANIFDLAIDESEENSLNIVKFFVARGWVRHPSLRYIRFQRELKDDVGYRQYQIKYFFNGGNYGKQ
jgi:hypothetical protein